MKNKLRGLITNMKRRLFGITFIEYFEEALMMEDFPEGSEVWIFMVHDIEGYRIVEEAGEGNIFINISLIEALSLNDIEMYEKFTLDIIDYIKDYRGGN